MARKKQPGWVDVEIRADKAQQCYRFTSVGDIEIDCLDFRDVRPYTEPPFRVYVKVSPATLKRWRKAYAEFYKVNAVLRDVFAKRAK